MPRLPCLRRHCVGPRQAPLRHAVLRLACLAYVTSIRVRTYRAGSRLPCHAGLMPCRNPPSSRRPCLPCLVLHRRNRASPRRASPALSRHAIALCVSRKVLPSRPRQACLACVLPRPSQDKLRLAQVATGPAAPTRHHTPHDTVVHRRT